MSDVGKPENPSVEEKFATPRIVKNARMGQAYSVGIGLPKETFSKEINLFSPPLEPHFFQADNFQLIKEGQEAERDETLIDGKKVNILYMHGLFKDGQWVPGDKELQLKGITVEDIVKDHELSGSPVDVLFVCSNENNSMVNVIPFQDKYERPKVYMRNKPAQGSVMLDGTTGEIKVEMRVKSEEDVEFKKWKKWGRIKVV